MRILAISHLFPNEVERRYGIFVSRQLSAMAAEGADITVLVPRLFCAGWARRILKKPAHYNHKLALLDVPGLRAIRIPYIGLPGQWFNRWSGLVVYMALRKTAWRLHRQHNFDVIYASELFLNGDAGRRLSKAIDVPVACLAIGSDINVTAKATPSLGRHFQRIVTEMDGTLACGKSAADEMQRLGPKRDTLCVYGVVDLKKFAPVAEVAQIRRDLHLPIDGILVLYVGYLWNRKGLRELIEAFAKVHTQCPSTTLIICGAGNDEKSIISAADRSAARAAIRFVGGVDPCNVHRYLQASDVFVLPSYAEGMPNAVMEAMACGLPVVTTTVGGLPAALGGSEGAILVPPKDVNSLKDALMDVINNKQKRERMGRASRQLAEEDFGVQRNARKILDYLSLVTNQQTPTSVR